MLNDLVVDVWTEVDLLIFGELNDQILAFLRTDFALLISDVGYEEAANGVKHFRFVFVVLVDVYLVAGDEGELVSIQARSELFVKLTALLFNG